MKVLIIGDSHAAILQKGKDLMAVEDGCHAHIDITINPLGNGRLLATPFFVDRGDHAEIVNPTYRRRFARLPLVEEAGTSIVYGFSGPLHSSRVWRHPDWSRFAPAAVADEEAPVSAALIRRIVLDDQKYVLGLLDILMRAGKRTFVIEPPLPFRHHRALKDIRPEVLIHTDGEYRTIVRQELSKRSIPVVSVPAECIGADGFMLDSFKAERDNDQHHGNTQFGRLMMKAIVKFLEKP